LDLLYVDLNLNWILPGDTLSIIPSLALWISNNILEALSLIEHHRLLAFNHLSAHRVIEVSYLLQSNSLFVVFLGIFSNNKDVLVDFESHFSKHSSVLDESDELITVVNFEKASRFVVELHELTAHLVLILLIGVIEGFQNGVVPFVEKIVFVFFDVSAYVFAFIVKLLHRGKITKQTLSDLLV